ncbi:Type 1 glutamine amidotransferase-like domain-containing protein [uncultured Shewanella sp.]|uniref:Type 1 glutamine amidotransferase-like domain-containing protein n=1 Tax=uncultured Shewanella sp. TaxID=173975 RepID=UPI00262C139C|nr:Type 1 glutamine amidotransferase-like domain-containing protein [uncultured Shewanella sp.]
MSLALISDPSTKNGTAAIKLALTDCHSPQPQVGYIASEPDIDRRYFTQTKQIYDKCGVELSTYIELEAEFDDGAFQHLLTLDVIHLSGGNTYRFLFALHQRHLLPALSDYVQSGGVLIGVSAGAMIMTPSIVTASLCGDVNSVGLTDLSGLGLTSFTFVPHGCHSDEEVDSVRQFVKEESVRCYLCRDEDSLVLLKGHKQWTLFGKPMLVI